MVVRDEVAEERHNYFQLNDMEGISPTVVWEAHRCVITGMLIRHGARLKKENETQVDALL